MWVDLRVTDSSKLRQEAVDLRITTKESVSLTFFGEIISLPNNRQHSIVSTQVTEANLFSAITSLRQINIQEEVGDICLISDLVLLLPLNRLVELGLIWLSPFP